MRPIRSRTAPCAKTSTKPSPTHVNTVTLCIYEYIVTVRARLGLRKHGSITNRKCDEPRGRTKDHDKFLTHVIECHGKVLAQGAGRPSRKYLPLGRVHHLNRTCVGHVHEGVGTVRLKLKSLRVRVQRDVRYLSFCVSIDHSQRAAAVPNKHSCLGSVRTNVVGVISEVNSSSFSEVEPGEEPH